MVQKAPVQRTQSFIFSIKKKNEKKEGGGKRRKGKRDRGGRKERNIIIFDLVKPF